MADNARRRRGALAGRQGRTGSGASTSPPTNSSSAAGRRGHVPREFLASGTPPGSVAHRRSHARRLSSRGRRASLPTPLITVADTTRRRRLRRLDRSRRGRPGSLAAMCEHVATLGLFLDQHPPGVATRRSRGCRPRSGRCLRGCSRAAGTPPRRLLHVVRERSHAREDRLAVVARGQACGDRAHARWLRGTSHCASSTIGDLPDKRRRFHERHDREAIAAETPRAVRAAAARCRGRSPPRAPSRARPCSGCGTGDR